MQLHAHVLATPPALSCLTCILRADMTNSSRFLGASGRGHAPEAAVLNLLGKLCTE